MEAETSTAAVAGASRRRWEDLNSDLLVAIFGRVGVVDLVGNVPFVCSSWRDAARDPHCWRNLDFRDWNPFDNVPDFPDLLDLAVSRSRRLLESIYFPCFADEDDLLIVAERSPGLLYFSLPDACAHEDKFCDAVGKLTFLRGMAVDESLISRQVLQHVNKCCIYFTELRVFAEVVDDQMASVICESLPCLQKLEITESTISRQAIIILLDGLKQLEHLDISGYKYSSINDVILEKASRLKAFLWYSKFELGEFKGCSNCEEDCLFQRPCECMLDFMVMEWLAELS